MSGIANWQAQIRIDIEDLKKRIKVAEGEINNFTNEDRKVIRYRHKDIRKCYSKT